MATDFFEGLSGAFALEGALPHGICLLWHPGLIWLHVISDSLTAAAYYSIPVALAVFAIRRRDLEFRWVFLLFGLFIMACGTTHLMGVWTLWRPDYVVDGLLKALTALASVLTAAVLWPLIPKALALPGPARWDAVNRTLETEIAERRCAESRVRHLNTELEQRVRERTIELERANHALEEANRMLRSEVEQRSLVEAELRRNKMKALEALAEAEQHKAESERANIAKTRFLAAASHDLRQPAQAIVFLVAAIRPRCEPIVGEGVFSDMERALAGLRGILDTLLDISKLDAGVIAPRRERVHLCGVLARAVAEAAPSAREKGLVLRVVKSTIATDSDPILLSQIVQNLVTNAIRYTESGKVLVGCRRHGDFATIQVWDTGIGIPSDKLEQIFEEFYQVGNSERDREKGLGLGLAIVRRLSHLLGHQIAVRSECGKGTVFSVRVPLAAGGGQRRP